MRIIAANWKMNHSPQETLDFFSKWSTLVTQVPEFQQVTSLFFIPNYCWPSVTQFPKVLWGIQNFYPEIKGAFTGECSASIMKELGATWALVGHSERRHLFNESLDFINKKIIFSHQTGLKPILCVGETQAEKADQLLKKVLQSQLESGLKGLTADTPLTIAYEPVWAIGTGLTAKDEDIIEAHNSINECIKNLGFTKPPIILYGGSVKPDNAQSILKLPDVNGLLVGGASLNPHDFFKIVQSANDIEN